MARVHALPRRWPPLHEQQCGRTRRARYRRRAWRIPCRRDYTLIETCKFNDVDARVWLADVLARIADHPAKQMADLLPWNWKGAKAGAAQAV
jgi:hypothetical protein